MSQREILIPLAAAQFLASYDTSSMNVAISNIVKDLDTTVTGVQTAISLFTLTMAALMIPGSKLTDIWGRKRCFRLGLTVYGTGALITSLAPVLVAAMATSLSSGLTVARPRPGKCFGLATTPPSWRPWAKATPTVVTTAGLEPKVRLLIVSAVFGCETSRTGARSTLIPRLLR